MFFLLCIQDIYLIDLVEQGLSVCTSALALVVELYVYFTVVCYRERSLYAHRGALGRLYLY